MRVLLKKQCRVADISFNGRVARLSYTAVRAIKIAQVVGGVVDRHNGDALWLSLIVMNYQWRKFGSKD